MCKSIIYNRSVSQQHDLPVPKSILEKVHDWICVVVIAGMLLYTGFMMVQLPGTVPIHFNINGEPDGWGSKWVMWIVPAISVLLYMIMTLVGKHPENHNYPFRLTKRNAKAIYCNSKAAISWVKLEIVVMFAYVNWSSIQNSLGRQEGIGIWAVLSGITVVLITLLIFVIRLFRIKSHLE